MNILPLIFAFIIVFSLCTSLLIEEKRTTFTEMQNYLGYMQGQRELHNQAEKRRYSKAAPNLKKEEKEKKGKTLKSNAVYTSRREIYPPLEISRLNISLLIEEPNHPSYDKLYEVTSNLLKELYSHASFYKEGFEKQTLDALIETGDFSSAPYKLLKGTTHYNISKKEGYPPITEFLCIDKSMKDKPIHFCFAGTPLLKALLGDKLTSDILEKEKEKWDKDHKHHTVTKDEITAFLSSTNTSLLELLSFTKHSSPKKELVTLDITTNLSVRKRI